MWCTRGGNANQGDSCMPCTFLDGHMVRFPTNRTESLSNDIVVYMYVITHAAGMIIIIIICQNRHSF